MYRILLIALCGLLLTVTEPRAHDMKHSGIVAEQAWARASAGPAKAGAAYLTLANHGDEADRLVSVKSDLAKRTEIHNHVMDGGVMKMVHVEGGVEVTPGSPTVFQPGGLHVMFMGLNKPFIEGETLPLTLVFEKAGEVEVEFVVQGVGAKEPAHGMHDGHNHKHGS
ncbi:MAG: copper chaperone PCu(A)C [Rhodospirillales bacterium]